MAAEAVVGWPCWYHDPMAGPKAAIITKVTVVPPAAPHLDPTQAVNLWLAHPGGYGPGCGDTERLEGIPWVPEYPQGGTASMAGTHVIPIPPPPPAPPTPHCRYQNENNEWKHLEFHCVGDEGCDVGQLPPLPDDNYPPGSQFVVGCTGQ